MMIEVSEGLELDTRDRKVKLADGKIAQHKDVALRYDLPKDHPLYGRPALKVVLSGMGDSTLDDEGKMVPIDIETGLPTDDDGIPVEVLR